MARKIVLFVFVVGTVLVGTMFLKITQDKAETKIKIGDGTFTVRVADTEAKRTRGLGGVEALAPDEGMLFMFPTDDFHAMWMKDMRIPIDILWLARDFSVIDAREHVSPDSFPTIFQPKAPTRFVVELKAGAISSFQIKTGTRAALLSE